MYCVTLPIGIFAIWIFVPITAICIGISWNNLLATTSNQADSRVQGKVFGIMSTIWALAYFLCTFFSGAILIHGPKIPLIIGSILIVIAAILYKFFSIRMKPVQK